MSNLKFIGCLIVMVATAAALWLQHSWNENLRHDNDALRATIAELKQLQEGHESGVADKSLTEDQQAELLKLRAEVTQLRTQTNQIAVLTEANQKLSASLKEARTAPTASKKKEPPDALPQDIHPRESWAFRGYGSPDATIESTCWALINGDKALFLSAFSPEMLPEMEKQLEGKDFAKEFANPKKENMAEFRILDRRQLSDDQMVVTIYMARKDADGNLEGNPDKTVFQRIGGEWKVTGKPAPEN